jgi:hypothetical protein
MTLSLLVLLVPLSVTDVPSYTVLSFPASADSWVLLEVEKRLVEFWLDSISRIDGGVPLI